MIHGSSIISKKTKIGKNVKIGPFCNIGDFVDLGDNVELISNVHIEGHTTIGNGTKIFPFASIGTTPQDLKFKNEPNSLIIGERNTIREYVTINPGTTGGGGQTTIGNDCLFMISSHVAHDCKIGNNVISNLTIMGNMGRDHKQTIITYCCLAASTCCSWIYCYIFSNRISFTYN